MPKPNYRFYATLLDSYQWFLDSDNENSFQEFIDKINRVPFEKTEPALKGIAFNELVDAKNVLPLEIKKDILSWKGFEFKRPLLNTFLDHFRGAASQIYTNTYLATNNGTVELYGFADKVLQDKVSDIKCTSKYEFPKFIKNWQHKVYPYCFNENDIKVSVFDYVVTDYNNFYIESYAYRPETDIPLLKGICEDLIHFLETNRHLITDKKIFNLQ